MTLAKRHIHALILSSPKRSSSPLCLPRSLLRVEGLVLDRLDCPMRKSRDCESWDSLAGTCNTVQQSGSHVFCGASVQGGLDRRFLLQSIYLESSRNDSFARGGFVGTPDREIEARDAAQTLCKSVSWMANFVR